MSARGSGRDARGRFLTGHGAVPTSESGRLSRTQRRERRRIRDAYIALGRSPRWAAARAGAYTAAVEFVTAVESMSASDRVAVYAARRAATTLIEHVLEEVEQFRHD